MMKGGQRGGNIAPPGEDPRRRLIFEDFWNATEIARILIADPAQWEASFVGSFSGVLSINERLALPGRKVRVVRVTGDATLERLATVDWTHRLAATGEILAFRAPLAALIGEVCDESDIIATAEFLNLVTFAAHAGSRGLRSCSIVFYTGDNSNVRCWIESRR